MWSFPASILTAPDSSAATTALQDSTGKDMECLPALPHSQAAYSAAPIFKSRFGRGIAVFLVWHALGAAVEAACNAGNYTTSTGTCAPCEAGFFCASGEAFTARGAVDGQGIGMLDMRVACCRSLTPCDCCR